MCCFDKVNLSAILLVHKRIINKDIEITLVQVSLLLCPRAPQLSRDVPAYAGSQRGKAAVFRDTIKGTPCVFEVIIPQTFVHDVR